MHSPYEKRLNHPADFRVKYTFRLPEQGGRPSGPPRQGIRSDVHLEGDVENHLFCIWPEFEDSEGNVILQNETPVPLCGTARMWVINPQMRPLHYDNIFIGKKGTFREGSAITGDFEVIEILSLKDNPIKI